MRITKKVREEAARICALIASNDLDNDSFLLLTIHSGEAGDLACAAERVAWGVWWPKPNDEWSAEASWAEAEAMLRTGWCPNG